MRNRPLPSRRQQPASDTLSSSHAVGSDGRVYIAVNRKRTPGFDAKKALARMPASGLGRPTPPGNGKNALAPASPATIDEDRGGYLEYTVKPADDDLTSQISRAPTVELEPPSGAAPKRAPMRSFEVSELRAAGIDVPARRCYPAPELCRCAEMVAATPASIDVSLDGPVIYRSDGLPAEDCLIGTNPWQLSASAFALRHCPFDGTLMDPNVPLREQKVVGADGSLYCCAWLLEMHAAGRVRIVDATHRHPDAYAQFSMPPITLHHCSHCGASTAVINHRRMHHFGHR